MFKTLISAVKATVSVIALALAFTLNASAQDRPANGAQRMTDRMKTQLSLNDAQYNKVLEINNEYVDKTTALRKSTTADKKEVSESIKTLSVERETKLKAVLTADQLKKYEENKQAKKAQFQSEKQIEKGNGKFSDLKPANSDKKIKQ